MTNTSWLTINIFAHKLLSAVNICTCVIGSWKKTCSTRSIESLDFMACTTLLIKPWSNFWAVLSQGMANSQIEPWNNLWADLSQGMANSHMEPWNNLWADLSQGMVNSKIEPWTWRQYLGWPGSIQPTGHVHYCVRNLYYEKPLQTFFFQSVMQVSKLSFPYFRRDYSRATLHKFPFLLLTAFTEVRRGNCLVCLASINLKSAQIAIDSSVGTTYRVVFPGTKSWTMTREGSGSGWASWVWRWHTIRP